MKYLYALLLAALSSFVLNAQTAHAGATIPVGTGFTNPFGAAVDGYGNVFVADYGNQQVKEIVAVNGVVSATSTVKIIASGFTSPKGVTVDGHGNVFVADNRQVKEIVAVNGTVSAASTVNVISSSFSSTTAIAVDASGNVFVADQGYQKVYEIVAVSGVVSSASAVIQVGSGFNDPHGVAVDGYGNVFVVDAALAKVYEIVAVSGVVSATSEVDVVGSGFANPQGVAVDGHGNVFLADPAGRSSALEIVAVNGAVSTTSTVQPVGTGYSYPIGVAVDASGNVFVANEGANNVLETLSGTQKLPSTPVGSTSAPLTVYFTFDTAGSLAANPYIVLTQGAQNLDFQPAATQPANACVAGQGYNPGDTCAVNVTFTPTKPYQRIGAVQLMGASGTPIATVNLHGSGTGPQVIFPSNSNVPTISNTFNNPNGIAVDGSGNIFVADLRNNAVKKIAAGSSTIMPVGSNFSLPASVAMDGSGNIFVADANGVEQIVALNGVVLSTSTVVPIGSGFSNPTGVAVDASGNVFVADSGNNAVKEIVAVNGVVSASSVVNLIGSGFSTPNAVAVDASGNVFVADKNGVEEIVALNGVATAHSTVTSVGSGFNNPQGVAVDGLGNVYVADFFNNALKEIVAVNGAVSSSSAVVTLAQGYPGGGLAPYGVALDANGDVFLSDYSNNNVDELNRATPPSLSFPAVNSVQSIPFQNSGNAILTGGLTIGTNFAQVAGAGTPADCATTFSLSPGSECNLSISFTLPPAAGSFQSTAAFTDNALNANAATQIIKLLGNDYPPAQNITFNNPGTQLVGVPLNIIASTDSGLPLSYSVTGNCSIAGTVVTFTQIGYCVITVSQAGNASVGNASVTQTVTVAPPVAPAPANNSTFPATGVNTTSAAATFTFTFAASETLAATPYTVVTQGVLNLDFQAAATQPANVCVSGHLYNFGDTCAVNVTFTPKAAGVRMGAIQFFSTQGYVLGTQYIGGIGNGSVAAYGSATVTEIKLTGFQTASGLAIDPTGAMILADNQGNQVLTYPAGQTTPANSFPVTNPLSVALDGAGNIYATNPGNTIFAIQPASGAVVGINNLDGGDDMGPFAVAVDPLGNLFYTSGGGYYEYSISSQQQTDFFVQTEGHPSGGITIDPAGNVYSVPYLNQYNKNTNDAGDTYTNLYNSLETSASTLASDAAGNVYIVEIDGTLVEFVGGDPGNRLVIASGYNLRSVAIDSQGNLYSTDISNSHIYKIARTQPPSLTFQSTPLNTTSLDSPQPVPVQNIGNQPLTISNFAADANFSASNANCPTAGLTPGSTCSLAVSFTPTQFGPITSTLTDGAVAIGVSGSGLQGSQKITFNNPGVQVVGVPLTLTATATSNLAVSYQSTTQTVCTVSSATVTFLAPGPCSLTASQLGNASYSAAMSVTQTFTVSATPIAPSAPNNGAFPNTNVGVTSAATTVTFTFDERETLAATPYVALTQGALNLDFQAAATQPANVCAGGHSYNAADSCMVNITFTPTKPYQRIGAVQLMGSAGTPIATFNLVGTGTGPQVTFPSNSAVTTLPSGSGFGYPTGVAVDGRGDIFVADSSHNAVKEIVAVNGVVSSTSSVITVGSGFNVPQNTAVDGSGNVFVADTHNNAVKEIIAVNGVVSSSSTVITVGSGFNQPQAVAVDRSGNVFVADNDNSAVKEIVAVNGLVSSSSTVVTLASGFQSYGVAVDASGNVFASDLFNAAVKEIVAVGGVVSSSSSVITVGSGFSSPFAVAVDGSGNVFVADYLISTVKEIVAVNGLVSSSSSVITLGSGFYGPEGVAVDASGNVFVADSGSNLVKELDRADPPSLTFANTNVNSTSSDSPQTVTVQNSGNASLQESALTIGTNFTQVAGNGTPADCTATTTLLQGASCNLSISFKPTTSGPLSAFAVLTNNAPTSPQSISLSGTGVVPPSTLSVTITPNGSFTQGQTAEWDVQVYNLAALASDATSGTTTLVDTLPAGYTLSSFVGTGWNCLAVTTTVTCTSTQVVAGASGAFTKLQLIVNVPGASAISVTDNVSVYGGGDPTHTSLGSAATAFSTVSVVQTAGSITAGAGTTPQSTTVNTAFPTSLAVTVKDSGGNPVSGVYVTFTAPSTGPSGVFSNSTNTITVQTSSSGLAFAPFTANTTAGANYSVTATVGQLSTPFLLTNTAAAAASITASTGTPQSATINTAFANPLAVTVKDTYGNPVSGANVVFTAPSTGPSGTFSNSTSTITVQTNASGIASAPLTANSLAGGTYNVTATAGPLSTPFSLTNTAGAAASITANTGTTPQSTNVNAAFPNPLAVTVKDSGGNPVSGVSVTFSAAVGGAFSNNSFNVMVPTNSSGVASATFVANARAQGPYTVTASANAGQLIASFLLTNNFLTQTIQNFGTIPSQTVGTPLLLTATATSGLPVIYQSNTSTVCSVSPSTAIFLEAGACSITAEQLGNGTYSAATPVTQQFTVNPNTPTISNLQAVAVGGNSELITWTTDQPSTTQVTYGVTSTPLDSNLVTFHSVTLTGLSQNTAYTYNVSSTNSTNGTATSQNATFTVTPLVGYVAFWGVNNSGVTISWSTDFAATTFVAYGTTTALGQTTPVQTALSNGHGVVLTGLNPGTTYYFRAESTDANGHTGASTIYTFTTTGAPASPAPVITNVTVTSITTTSATITWTTDQASSSQVNYGTTTAYGSSSTLNSSLITSHSVTLTGLIPGTTYNYDVISTNSSGTSSGMSTNYTFQTTAIVSTPPAISNIQSSVTSTTATITWTTDQAANSSVNYVTSATTPDSSYVTSHSVTLTGLTPGTLYNFTVISKNAAGLSTTSPSGTFTTTASSATPPQVGYVAFWGVNNSGVTISWSTDVPANTQLAYGTTPALGQLTPVQTTLANSHGVVLTGLSSGTTYYFVAQSTGSNGATGSSTTYSFTTTGTPSAPAPVITTVQANTTNSSVTITWNTDQAATSQVNYGPTTSYTSSSTLSSALVTTHSVTISNLSPGTTYHFDVVSANSSGTSATSSDSTFTTTGSAPGPVISSVSASSITSGTALITWTTDQASSSQVNYGNTSTSTPALVTAHSVTLSGLTPNTMYTFYVTSTNAASVSTTSSNYTFTTSTASASAPVISYLAFWGVTNSSVVISWSTDVPSNTSVAYGTTSALGQVTPVQTTLTNSHGLTLTGLQPSTTYYFEAQSADVNGNTGTSALYTFTTLAGGAPMISTVLATPSPSNTATITWTTSVPAYSYVQYGPSHGNYNRYSAQTNLTTAPQCTLPYVPSGTVYYQLVSTDSNGNQTVSPEATFVEP